MKHGASGVVCYNAGDGGVRERIDGTDDARVMKRIVIWAMAAGLAAGGCATSSSGEAEEKLDGSQSRAEGSETIDADPMLVRGGDDVEGDVTVDSEEVFDRAYEAYSARQYEEAVEHYETIVEYFEGSRFYQPSLYNGGLAYEKLERWEAAARMYRRIIDDFPNEENTTDAYFRLAQVYEEMGEHEEIVELMTEVMLRDDASRFDRVEAHTRRSTALIELRNLGEAEDGFRSVLKINENAPPDQKLPTDSRYICQAYFGLGEIFRKRQAEIQLTLPPETMGDDLDEKAKLLLEAQQYYLQALRQHHADWSMAAGYMIGRLYEDFYSDIFSAEVPEGLSEEQVAMYFEELESKIRPVMERAIKVYEKNLSLSKRIGETPENNRWVAETAESLRRMKEYLNDPDTRERAQELALRGRDFRALWEPWDTARDQVDRALDHALDEVDGATVLEGRLSSPDS